MNLIDGIPSLLFRARGDVDLGIFALKNACHLLAQTGI